MVNKQTPAWAHVIKVGGVDAEGKPATATRCKHCGHSPSASAWRFQICPRCGYRGGEIKSQTTIPRPMPGTPVAPVQRPVAPATDTLTGMTEGEREFTRRVQELTKHIKGGN